jgi:hypothetical protein
VLLIGVDDKKKVLGLEGDYKTLKEKPKKDGFELTLQQTPTKAVGSYAYVRDVRIGFCDIDDKENLRGLRQPLAKADYHRREHAVGNPADALRPCRQRDQGVERQGGFPALQGSMGRVILSGGPRREIRPSLPIEAAAWGAHGDAPMRCTACGFENASGIEVLWRLRRVTEDQVFKLRLRECPGDQVLW